MIRRAFVLRVSCTNMGFFRIFAIGSLLIYLSGMTFLNLRFDQTPKPVSTWCVCRPINGDDPTRGTWVKSSLKTATGEWCDVDEYIGQCNPQTDFMPITAEMVRPASLTVFALDMTRAAYLMFVGSIVSTHIVVHALRYALAKTVEVKSAERVHTLRVLPELIVICLLTALVIYIETVVYRGFVCMGISCYPQFPGN